MTAPPGRRTAPRPPPTSRLRQLSAPFERGSYYNHGHYNPWTTYKDVTTRCCVARLAHARIARAHAPSRVGSHHHRTPGAQSPDPDGPAACTPRPEPGHQTPRREPANGLARNRPLPHSRTTARVPRNAKLAHRTMDAFSRTDPATPSAQAEPLQASRGNAPGHAPYRTPSDAPARAPAPRSAERAGPAVGTPGGRTAAFRQGPAPAGASRTSDPAEPARADCWSARVSR